MTDKKRPFRLALAISLTVFGASIAASCTAEPELESDLDILEDTLWEQRTTVIEGYDCSVFQSYPDVPDYVGPGPHCNKKDEAPDNPGCPAGTQDACTIPENNWEGPYDIYDNNCHDAASCGVDAGTCQQITTGVYSCTGNESGNGGHTVNYTVVPGTGDNAGKFVICLSEPQQSDPNSDKCCWVQDTNTPETGPGDPGRACYEYHCWPQAKPGGGTALPPGQCWPTPSQPDCGDEWNATSRQCCIDYAKRWDHTLPTMCSEAKYNKRVQNRCDAYASCVASTGYDLDPLSGDGTVVETESAGTETDTDTEGETEGETETGGTGGTGGTSTTGTSTTGTSTTGTSTSSSGGYDGGFVGYPDFG